MLPITGILSAIDLITGLVGRVQAISALISKAQAEGRDITTEELESLVKEDDTARAALVEAIAKAKAEGR